MNNRRKDEKVNLTKKIKRNIKEYIRVKNKERKEALNIGDRKKYRDIGLELKGANIMLLKIGFME